MDLFASTTGTDSDWVVKLIDVYPNDVPEARRPGREAGDGRLRAADRHRDLPRPLRPRASRKPAPLTPGKVEEYNWNLPNVDHVFLPGHRIMVQVQSSLFPLYDRNPQTYVETSSTPKRADYRPEQQKIFYGGSTASAVLLPIVP